MISSRFGAASPPSVHTSVPVLFGVGLALALGCSEALDAVDSATGFDSIYESEQFQECAGCHAPDAPGFVEGTEATQDWSTRDTAHTTLHRSASGLIGNFAGCNGVPFLGATAEQSLLVAALDETVRVDFSVPGMPSCDGDAIADQTDKIGGPLPDDLLQDLKDWINGGAL
ncbi:MAG TPA: hypothetical protein VNN80_00290 [Polyangiaceae bacterium]|nr:hypothetical protein [Polyangiaceae bacterium]